MIYTAMIRPQVCKSVAVLGFFCYFFFTYLYLNHPRHNYRAAAVGSERTIAKGDAFFFQYAIVVVRMTEKMQLKR